MIRVGKVPRSFYLSAFRRYLLGMFGADDLARGVKACKFLKSARRGGSEVR